MQNWNVRFAINGIAREVPQEAQFVRIEHPKNGVKVKAFKADDAAAYA